MINETPAVPTAVSIDDQRGRGLSQSRQALFPVTVNLTESKQD